MARIEWADLPAEVRRHVERVVGGEVCETRSQTGGFSTGLASRAILADGRRVFVKAISTAQRGTYDLYLREADVLRAIPRELPAAHLVDASICGAWAVLVIEDIAGRNPERSAASADTVLVLDAIGTLATVPAGGALPRLADELAGDADSWRRLEAAGMLDTTTTWCVENVALLRDAAQRVGDAVTGEHLVHGDLRPDNVVIAASGRAVLVDWPWAATGAGWEDALLYLLDLRVADPAADIAPLFDHPVFATATAEDCIALLAAVSGNWFEQCRLPAPDGMAMLRDFQRREALASVEMIVQLVEHGLRGGVEPR